MKSFYHLQYRNDMGIKQKHEVKGERIKGYGVAKRKRVEERERKRKERWASWVAIICLSPDSE